MDRRVTTPTWGPPPPCKQDLNIPLQNNSGNRDNKTHVLCPTLQTRTCIGVLKSIIMFFHSFIALEYAFKCFFFTVNSSIKGDHLAGGSFTENALNKRLFPFLHNQSLWCSG